MRRIGSVVMALAVAAVAAGCSGKSPSKFDTGTTGTTGGGSDGGTSGTTGTTGGLTDCSTYSGNVMHLKATAMPTGTVKFPVGDFVLQGNTKAGATPTLDGGGASASVLDFLPSGSNPGFGLNVYDQTEGLSPGLSFQVGNDPSRWFTVLQVDSTGTGTGVQCDTNSADPQHGSGSIALSDISVTPGTATLQREAGEFSVTCASLGVTIDGCFKFDSNNAGGTDGGNPDAGSCADLTGVSLEVFSLAPSTIAPLGGGTPNEANFQVIAKRNGQGVPGCLVNFSEEAGGPTVSLTPGSASTQADGTAATTIKAGSDTGTAQITATLGSLTKTVSLIVGQNTGADAGAPVATKIKWVSTFPSGGVAVAGSGNETGYMTFEVDDQYGKPMPGVDVDFAITGTPLVTLAATSGQTSSSGSNSGEVSVNFTAGTSAGVTSIQATVHASSPVVTVTQNLAVHSGTASASGFSFTCEKYNIPVYTTLQNTEQVTCHVALKDNHGNPVDSQPTVAFYTEAGTIAPGSIQVGPDGKATVTFTTDIAPGFPPANVDPFPADPNQFPVPRVNDEPSYQVGAQTFNPRDQLITLVAVTLGEEAYTDENANGKFDPGTNETFVDLPDPFVDANDDNTWDAFSAGGQLEQKFCSVQNHPVLPDGGFDCSTFSPGNGAWDAKASIWTAIHVVFTGVPQISNYPNTNGGVMVSPAGSSPQPFVLTGGGTGCIPEGASASMPIFAYDDYLNVPGLGTTITWATPGGPTLSTPKNPLDNFGSTDFDSALSGYYPVAESDGGLCNSSNGQACVLKFLIQGFSTGQIDTLTASDTNSNATPSCYSFSVNLNSASAHNTSSSSTVSGSYSK